VPVVNALKQELREKRVDCLILDPFIRTHGVSENDNNAFEQVATVFAEIADEVDCSIELVHHTRKPPPGGDGERTVDDGRGASSLIAKARSARVLNVMTKTEANDVGIEPNKRSLHFRIDNGKANMQPPAETAKWRKLVSVPLDNATADDPEDWVQVATQWEMPGALEGVTSAHLSQVIATVRADGEYRADPRAAKWIGKLVANVIGADLKEPIGERKVKRALKAWFQSKALAEREGKDASRRTVAFVEVGPGWEDESGPAQV